MYLMYFESFTLGMEKGQKFLGSWMLSDNFSSMNYANWLFHTSLNFPNLGLIGFSFCYAWEVVGLLRDVLIKTHPSLMA